MSADQTFRVHAPDFIRSAKDDTAVIIGHGQMAIHLSIAQARELSLALAKAADDAELKLKSLVR